MKISVVINTLNSEKILRKCLDSVKDFDEIIICDMYSSDGTLSIAAEYNCKIIMHEQGGGIVEPAREFAVKAANCDWVLVVDSDEIVTKELKDYLYSEIKKEKTLNGFFVPRKNFFLNKFMHSVYPDYQLRFFKKEKFIHWPVTIHAVPKIEGAVGKIPAKSELSFIHLDKNRVKDMVSKMNVYSERDLLRRKKTENLFGLLLKPFFRFFKLYILKGGFRDGKAGFLYANLRAYAKFLFIAKSIEQASLSKKAQESLFD